MNRELIQRITNYLAAGGLVNPELMDHEKVRYLLIDCRDELAKPEQEPVAWMGSAGLGYEKNKYLAIPLYTSPPRKPWVGLTDEEMPTLTTGTGPITMLPFRETKAFIRAIEAKLKEKNT